MKRVLLAIVCLGMVFSMASCTRVYHGTEALVEKAREEIPISDAENTLLTYAGMCGAGSKALVWFLSGNEYQAHYYLPMEVSVKENSADYTFVRIYKPIMRAKDIALLHWNNGISFVINDPNCKAVRFIDNNGVTEEAIPRDAYPYVFFHPFHSTDMEYVFLDADGKELVHSHISPNTDEPEGEE